MKPQNIRIGNCVYANGLKPSLYRTDIEKKYYESIDYYTISGIVRSKINGLYSIELAYNDLARSNTNKLTKLTYSLINIDTIQPIPLTENWLTRFGFEGKNAHKNAWGIWYGFSKFFQIHGKHNHLNEYYHYGNTDIIYVHQLQNLYFELTGCELKLIN